MTSTALERAHDPDVALFPGVTADEILAGATDVANKFSDVIKQRRMFRRIGDNDHIQIEAWQTIGALTGVLADDGQVEQLPWPAIEPLGEAPPAPGREPRNRDTPEYREWEAVDAAYSAWELQRDMLAARARGLAFGFVARFRVVKNGVAVGWGEGRCTRGEASKVSQPDYALSSMAQTRAQSRALGAPLKFVVKLAGYETTPAEELDGATGSSAPAAADGAPAPPWGPVADDEAMNAGAKSVEAIADGVKVDGAQFIVAMGQYFDGVPQACVVMLRGLSRYISDARAAGGGTAENAPPPAAQSAYHNPPTGGGAPS
jgi:hypothetical protein